MAEGLDATISGAARERLVSCWNAGDREGWIACWNDEPVVESPVGHDPPQRGRADVALRFDIGGGGQGTTIADACRIIAGRTLIAHVENRYEVDGQAIDSPSIEFYTFDDDGRISEMRVFTDDAPSRPRGPLNSRLHGPLVAMPQADVASAGARRHCCRSRDGAGDRA